MDNKTIITALIFGFVFYILLTNVVEPWVIQIVCDNMVKCNG